ncbi:hypothetical protein RFF05_02795 [Bengtsoniella intestinalis]|uniref:hypothetical protein n=1 Tax=Bengtsoniella intestinalis TaxID=3073143 RepID=UPI00391F8615
MTHVLLYWNHICVLHNQEKKHLSQVQQTLLNQGIDLEIRFFGLGYESHMCEYLAQPDAILPDIIVTADLEAVEQPSLYNKLGGLHPCQLWMTLKDKPLIQSMRRKDTLLPFVAIPLVCYTRDTSHCEGKTLATMASEKGFAFGGINNSAGKTITKLAWQTYGQETAAALLGQSTVYDMPIGAFQSVRMGQNTTALVPSLYAMRQDGVSTFATTLAEGTCLLPSYFACSQRISPEVGQAVMREILCPELCDFYAQQGNLIIAPDIKTATTVEDTITDYAIVTQEFLDDLDNESFYDLYTAKLPTAKPLPVV